MNDDSHLLTKGGSSSMEPGFECGNGDAKDLGRIFGRDAFDIAKENDFPFRRIESSQGRLKSVGNLSVGGMSIWSSLRGGSALE